MDSLFVAYKRVSRLRTERDLELYRLELEDRFGPVPDDDEESARFLEILRVRLLAQRLAVSEVRSDKGRLKLRLSPQTPVDAAKLMAWISPQKETALAPDGSVTLPVGPGGPEAAIQKAQEVLRAWEGLVG